MEWTDVMEEITQLQLFGDEDFTLPTKSGTVASNEAPDDDAIAFLTDIRRIALPMLSVRSFVYKPLSRVEEIPPTLLTEHQLVFVMEGSITCLIGGTAYTAQAGDCLYAAPGVLYCRPEGDVPAAYMTLGFWDDTPRREGHIQDMIFAYPHKMTYIDDADVSYTVDYLKRVCLTGSPDQRKKCLSALQMLLIQLEDFVVRYSDNDYVRAMKRYILEHYREGVQLEDLAEQVGLHPVYCAKVFKKCEGITVGDFINQLRISRAAAQLESAIETSDVAEDLGLSEFYFSRWFRRMTGVTPTEYRDSLRSAYTKH